VLVAIWSSWAEGDEAAAAAIYYRHLPMMVLEAPPGGLAIRKHVLMRRGLIAHDTVRGPAGALHPKTCEQVARMIEELEIEAAFPIGAGVR
jgi:4-hydroxy-tetrahydrodipicolinate synthase